VGDGKIEVDSVELVPFSSIDNTDVLQAGETDLESLRQRAAHAGRSTMKPSSTGSSSTSLNRSRPLAARRWSANADGIKWGCAETEDMLVSNPSSSKSKLTGRQKWLIAGLLFLQVPSSAIFYPLAAVFSLTGIGIPLSIIFLGIGTMPFSVAMKRKVAWQSGGGSEQSGSSQESVQTH
jgi:hypothetical protein